MDKPEYSTIQSGFVQLGSKRKPATFKERLASGTFADKFFAVGALGGFLGMAGYGAHIWLAATGQMTTPSGYGNMRHIHSSLQFFLFFAPFTLGFTIQAGAKLIGIPIRITASVLFLLGLLIVGSICKAHQPNGILGGVLLAAAFLSVMALYARSVVTQYSSTNKHAVFFLTASLVGYCIASFAPFTIAGTATILFWLTLVPALFAGGEQFISSFLGGKRLSPTSGLLLRILYSGSAVAGVLWLFSQSPWSWLLWSWSSLASVVTFIVCSDLLRLNRLALTKPIGFAILLSYCWAIVGAVLAISHGPLFADFILHIWATGWGVTTVFAVSAQIMAHLSGQALYKKKTELVLLLFWQLIPLGRGLSGLLPISPYFSWILTTVVSIVAGVWLWKVLQAEFRILRRQFSLNQGERLGSC